MSEEIVLYDLACKGGNKSWSFNVWKTRLVLNYKGLPYTTKWLTHPEIEPTVKGLGVPPCTNNLGSDYTVPTIKLPQKEGDDCVMDSLAIAKRLEQLYPDPPLHLNNSLHEQAAQIVMKIARPMLPAFMLRLSRDVIVESSRAHVDAKRQEKFGMSLEELESKFGGEQIWEKSKPGLDELKAFLSEHQKDEGPFVLGSEVSYADFVIVALMKGLMRIGEDLGERLLDYDESFRKLYNACGQWMEIDT